MSAESCTHWLFFCWKTGRMGRLSKGSRLASVIGIEIKVDIGIVIEEMEKKESGA